jgi:hypothetical protein
MKLKTIQCGITTGALILGDGGETQVVRMDTISYVQHGPKGIRIYTGDGGRDDTCITLKTKDERQARKFVDNLTAQISGYGDAIMHDLDIEEEETDDADGN